MAYCTHKDVEHAIGGPQRLREAAARGGVEASEETIDHAIAEADSMIDSYARRRYRTPFDPVPESIRRRSARLAAYFLKSVTTDRDHQTFAEIRDWLKELKSGDADPGIDPPPPSSSAVRDRQSPRPSSKAVSREKTKGFW